MLKKAITYKDIDGVTVTEEYHFQIDQSEAAKIMMIEGDDYGDRLKKLADERDGKKIMEAFDELLSAAVGRREGKLFIKNDEIYKHFRYSGAYNAFFMELINSEDSGAAQIAAMFPEEARESITKAMKEEQQKMDVVSLPESNVIDGVVGDALIQAEKPQPDTLPQPSPFPQQLEQAIQRNVELSDETAALPSPVSPQPATDDEPAWFTEMRYPTKQELMKMSPDQLQFAMKMKASKAFG